MLSVENSPPDPSCHPQLNTGNSNIINDTGDEIATPSPNLPLAEVDLVKPQSPSLHHLPTFSIRDYVFNSRTKNVKNNWPFSLKHLQLCLKHGVKDVLPPFQSSQAVKTRSSKPDSRSSCNFHEEPSSSLPNTNDQILESSNNGQLNHKLVKDACIATISCRSGGEHNLPSTTTSVSQSEIESVPTKRPLSSPSPLSTENIVEASVSASASASATVETASHPSRSSKTENTNLNPGKKCRLVVKFGGNSDRSSAEDMVSNSTAVSETMASKVCPVCKIFSSSSNTTLNAHIDQCLFAESTPKWSVDSRLTRHRIKPRKTRLMVDIYTTAKHCTLEELDRRNGTNWASVSSLPAQRTEMLEIPGEGGKRQRIALVHPEDAGEVGEVYIDASGTKLRILSKANDASTAASKVVDDLRPRNPSKGSKRNKFLSTKKKCHSKKHLKYLRLAPQSRKLFSHKARLSQISGGEGGRHEVEKGEKREEHQIQKQIESSDSGTLRQWACSKRTGLAKKVDNQGSHQSSKCNWHSAQDLLVETNSSDLGGSVKERNRVQKFTNLSENLISETSKRLEKSFHKALGNDNVGRSIPPPKRKGNPFSRNCRPSFHKKQVGIHGVSVDHSDGSPSASPKPSVGTHALGSKSLNLLSRKMGSSVSNQSIIIKSKHTAGKMCSARKMTGLNAVGKVDKEVGPPEFDQQYAFTLNNDDENFEREENTYNSPFGESTLHGIRQGGGSTSISNGQTAMSMEHSLPEPRSDGHDEGGNTDSSVRATDDFLDKVNVVESIEGTVSSLGRSANSKLLKLSNHSETQSNSNSLHSLDYDGMLYEQRLQVDPSEARFFEGEERYCRDEVGNQIIEQNGHMVSQLVSDINQVNSFPEDDPIQIPGPPGSFLPSPRHMGSDEFKGNSSLTTSRLQSSQDQLDLVDGESSDSPISAMSTISNPIAARSDLKVSESSSIGIKQKMKPDHFSTATVELVENPTVVPHRSAGAERYSFDGEKFEVNNKLSTEKRSLSFNGSQPCCCQRKERISQDVAPKYHESELLRRRKLASVTMPSIRKQIGCALSTTRANNSDASTEIFSPRSCHSLGSENVSVLPSVKSPSAASLAALGPGDCDSVSPSTPNPVLRLMGKNLMVVNKEEDTSIVHRPSLPCVESNYASGVSSSSMQNHDYRSFANMNPPHRHVIFSESSYTAAGQSFDTRLSNLRSVHVPAQVSEAPFPCGGFGQSMEPLMYERGYGLTNRVVHGRPKIRLNETSLYNMDNVVTTPSSSIKEIIVIDEVPESGVGRVTDIPKYSEGMKANQLVSSSIPIPVVPSYNSRHENPLSCYPVRDPSLFSQPSMTHSSNFHPIPPIESPVRWACTPEGTGVLHRGSYVASSTSPNGQSRSVLYYSPSFS